MQRLQMELEVSCYCTAAGSHCRHALLWRHIVARRHIKANSHNHQAHRERGARATLFFRPPIRCKSDDIRNRKSKVDRNAVSSARVAGGARLFCWRPPRVLLRCRLVKDSAKLTMRSAEYRANRCFGPQQQLRVSKGASSRLQKDSAARVSSDRRHSGVRDCVQSSPQAPASPRGSGSSHKTRWHSARTSVNRV